MKKGGIRAYEVKNRPLSPLFESKIELSIDLLGFGGRDSMVFGATGPRP